MFTSVNLAKNDDIYNQNDRHFITILSANQRVRI